MSGKNKLAVITIGFVSMVVVVVLVQLGSRTQAPDHSSLHTLVADLKLARAEADGDYHRFLYRLTHYLKEAIDDKPHGEVVAALEAQGVKLREHDGVLVGTFPGIDFVLGDGKKLELDFLFQKTETVSDTSPTTYRAYNSHSGFTLKLNRPVTEIDLDEFNDLGVVKKVFALPKFEELAKQYPIVQRIYLHYQRGELHQNHGPPIYTGTLEVTVTLCRRDVAMEESVTISCSAETEFEQKMRRIVSWIPYEILVSRSTVGTIQMSGDTYPSTSDDYLYLERVGLAESVRTEFAVAYSTHDLLQLPPDTESLEIAYRDAKVDLAQLRRFPRLRFLRMSGHSLSDAEVKEIASLPMVEFLDVQLAQAKSVERLRRMPKLKRIRINAEHGSSLLPLTTLKNLTSIDLGWFSNVDVHLSKGLAAMPNLERLSLPTAVAVTDVVAKELSRAKKLRRLSIEGGELSPKGLASLAQIRTLERLSIGSSRVDEDTLRALAELPELRRLYFTRMGGLSNKNIVEFARAKKLEAIYAYDCSFADYLTGAGFNALKKLLPGQFHGPLPRDKD